MTDQSASTNHDVVQTFYSPQFKEKKYKFYCRIQQPKKKKCLRIYGVKYWVTLLVCVGAAKHTMKVDIDSDNGAQTTPNDLLTLVTRSTLRVKKKYFSEYNVFCDILALYKTPPLICLRIF